MFKFLKKQTVDSYFLKEACPYSGKRELNRKHLLTVAGSLLCLGIGAILFFGNAVEKKSASAETDRTRKDDSSRDGSIDGNQSDGAIASANRVQIPRNYGASQLVRRGDGRTSMDGIPMGSLVPLKLLNKVLSSDNDAPVLAIVTEDVLSKNTVLIPEGTKAIGQASLDDTTRRLKMRFNTLVFPEGDQHSISGLGVLQDGSSGLEGDYHSGDFSKQAGRFIGDFVGGLADGMKDVTTQGQVGIPFQPGGIKNGLLNGISNASSDQAKTYGDQMKNVRPYLEVPAGVFFYLFLDKEFSR